MDDVSRFAQFCTLRSDIRGSSQYLIVGIHIAKDKHHAFFGTAKGKPLLGAQIGILAVLHTWGRAMIYHPHAHLLVPGGGVSRDGAVAYFSRRGYLVPGKALSRIFRGKFIAMLKAGLPEERMPTVARKKDWVVFCKHLDLGPKKAIAYLGRYLNRVAVNDARVRRLPGGDVSVSYRDEKQQKRVRLSPNEFLRR